ncbi:helix-turn-helix transcriptional regulator [Halobacterium wangiae]|uniref:helix-turn-helix transcriptional regulator n=1 Tax=Halobacterium wangiae TaxID=2902623 RepID=UPI001E31678E|nr:hypothetical protein [Halobacterium wangiae]
MERGAAWVAGLLVLATVLSPAAVATTPDGALGMPQEFDPDSVSLSASVQDDGDAEWTFTYRTRLTNDNETAAFESLQDDIRTNTSDYVGQFESRITATVDAAENSTGRQMSVENVTVSTRVNSLNEESLGVVTYQFEWHGFAATEENAIAAGDALEGFYLDNETSLTMSWPDGYETAEIDPEGTAPQEDAVQWQGPLEFGDGQPSVVVVPSATATTETTNATTTTDGGEDDESGGGLLVPALGGAVAVLLLGGAGWLYWRRETADRDGAGPAPSDAEEGGTGAATPGGDAGPDQPPSELLSNEERVQQFLESQGGRAKQQAVVEALGWTEAKTSQVVKQMREDDELESFRIGRENVLKLPEADAPGEGGDQ